MEPKLETSIAVEYKNKSQKLRVISEAWATKNMFCPHCGNKHINRLENNLPVADFRCDICGEIFELKAKGGTIGTKILDGAYSTMIERITSNSNPDLLIMQYNKNSYMIENFMLIPKFFFVPQIIERRKPLSSKAKRAGWVGCNILISDIPEQGIIDVIKNTNVCSMYEVVAKYNNVKKLQIQNIEARGWLLDVMSWYS